ncbi:GntR family transcriptional regulator [Alkalihalobacillus sp. LMS39]|uniref:GntR family transcriptional regulator n=1 Tax=Alkalihalobacillus sp. LMS39 TaxID=2924032 RepID=UPI001FB35E47|nr:GntR family transcriptional regulator [Alkalihalobacillus sp. LMS39]UOE95608.1 GntR family transcriptional regulator [Alkalihalobacillus sp. LMS39]
MQSFDDSRPIFLQIASRIADDIINETIQEGEQVPSTNQFAKHYNINPATAAKGINLLVDEGILFKKRGVGMFVSDGAREKIMDQRRDQFYTEFVVPLLHEAEKLQLSRNMVLEMIEKGREER